MFRLEKKFLSRDLSPLVKGKNFGHQIWLDTCSDRKKIFVEGPSRPPVKGKIFDTRFGLIHVQTGKKNFLSRDLPPPQNSKKLLWPRGGRYASCVHAGGLSCFFMTRSFCQFLPNLTNNSNKHDGCMAQLLNRE